MSHGPQKQFDRDEVLERATQLFWERGYEATGMTQLLEHVGIGRQSLYDTFGGKRALFLECLSQYFRDRMGPIMAQLRGPGSPLDNMRQVFKMFEKMAQESRFCGCMVGNTAAERGHNDPEVAEILAGCYRAMEDAFADALTRAQELGEISSKQDARGVAQVLVNTIQGVALLSKVHKDRDLARNVIRTSFSLVERALVCFFDLTWTDWSSL